jgi:hypothetical protein
VTLLFPPLALDATANVALIWVAVELLISTEMPEPAETERPEPPNPVPLIVTLTLFPISPRGGVMLVIVGFCTVTDCCGPNVVTGQCGGFALCSWTRVLPVAPPTATVCSVRLGSVATAVSLLAQE